jgi:hypothetical protein
MGMSCSRATWSPSPQATRSAVTCLVVAVIPTVVGKTDRRKTSNSTPCLSGSQSRCRLPRPDDRRQRRRHIQQARNDGENYHVAAATRRIVSAAARQRGTGAVVMRAPQRAGAVTGSNRHCDSDSPLKPRTCIVRPHAHLSTWTRTVTNGPWLSFGLAG